MKPLPPPSSGQWIPNLAKFLLALAVLPLCLRADHLDFVTVSATASPAYVKDRMKNGSPRRETYAFYQGKFFGGATRDPSVDKAEFADLAKALAPNLAQQNYFPARDARAADLLIVVNWGTTMEDYWSDKNDPENQFQVNQLNQDNAAYGQALQNASGSTSPTAAGQVMAAASQQQFDAEVYEGQGAAGGSTQNYNARLLGYGQEQAKAFALAQADPLFVSPEAESHLSDLTEERYFVILLAYDYQDILRNHSAARVRGAAKPPPQPLPIWEVRMNVRAAGNNFTQALPAMAQVASAYYGRNVDGLATLPTDVDRAGTVEVGTPKVMGVVK